MSCSSNTEQAGRAKSIVNGSVFLDHMSLKLDDFDWLREVERLTLWNVKIPDDFLSKLPSLWWIDWRGGSSKQKIEQISHCTKLRFLALNQIRNLTDIDFIKNLHKLEMLDLYGLTKVESIPALASLTSLKRIHIGQMKALESIMPALEAPNLQELQLHNWVKVADDAVSAIRQHPSLKYFQWYGENIPDKMWYPVRQAVKLPGTTPMHPEEWFGI